MKSVKENKRKFTFGALDVFLILAVILSAAGIAVRCVLTDENGILAVTPEKTSVAVQILIEGIENSSSDYFSEDAVFGVGTEGDEGRLMSVTVQPAEYYVENERGELEIAYEDAENGKRDVRCTVVVEGYYRDGIFMLGGKTPMLPGGTVRMSGGGISVTALIIDTAPVDGET